MKDIGSEWWFDPSHMEYGNAWVAGIARIASYHDETPAIVDRGKHMGYAKHRQYIMRFDAGHHLFANDDALFPINLLRTGPKEPVPIVQDAVPVPPQDDRIRFTEV